jgi:hypothetical protein
MWFKQLLSRIFHRDFTTRMPTAEERAEVDRVIAERHANGQVVASWTSDCAEWERTYMELFGGTYGRHMCCDGAVSGLACSQRRYACVGHYGVCCSRC